MNRKSILREKVRNTRKNKGEGIVSYLTRVWLVKDELATDTEKLEDDKLVKTTLNGFSKQWDVFVQVINGQDTLPSRDHLWTDFTQEEHTISLASVKCKSQQIRVVYVIA